MEMRKYNACFINENIVEGQRKEDEKREKERRNKANFSVTVVKRKGG